MGCCGVSKDGCGGLECEIEFLTWDLCCNEGNFGIGGCVASIEGDKINFVIFLAAIDGLMGSDMYPNVSEARDVGGLNGPHLLIDGLDGGLGGCDVGRLECLSDCDVATLDGLSGCDDVARLRLVSEDGCLFSKVDPSTLPVAKVFLLR